MAVTLLDSVNLLLKRVGIIAGDAQPLQSLTDGSRQRAIDLAIQVIGEGVDELFTTQSIPMPLGTKEGTVTLEAGKRAHALATDVVRLRFPITDRVNKQFMLEYPGGYDGIVQLDPALEWTGLPQYACLRPTDSYLFFERTPTANEDGRVYTYLYDKDLTLDEATDVMPFNAAVNRAMIPAWRNLWVREMRGVQEFDEGVFKMNLGRAARLLTKKQPRSDYSPRRRG